MVVDGYVVEGFFVFVDIGDSVVLWVFIV